MRKVFWTVALFIAVALAGCSDSGDDLDAGSPATDGDGDDGAQGTPEESDQVRTGEVPATWEIGQTWRYSTSFGHEVTLVVSDETGDGWVLDTPDQELAWFHTRDELSYLGTVGKDHLSGRQGDEPVQYFDFPLEEGKEWTTTWDGVERRIVTTEANETFRFEAYEGDQLAVEYDYNPEVGWFSEMVFPPGEEGGLEFSMNLRDHDTGWSGEVVRWEAQNHINHSLSAPVIGNGFSIDEQWDELWVRYLVGCAPVTEFYQITVAPLEGGSSEAVLAAGNCPGEEIIEVLDQPPPGQWFYLQSGFGVDPADPFLNNQVEVEVWSRSLETLDV